jgi:hypothetical protein
VLVVRARHLLRAEECGREPDAAQDDLREHRPAVAVEGARDDEMAVGARDVEPD